MSPQGEKYHGGLSIRSVTPSELGRGFQVFQSPWAVPEEALMRVLAKDTETLGQP